MSDVLDFLPLFLVCNLFIVIVSILKRVAAKLGASLEEGVVLILTSYFHILTYKLISHKCDEEDDDEKGDNGDRLVLHVRVAGLPECQGDDDTMSL